ncbi:MAG: hypothetical protein OXB87_03255 [Hyphomicrobiales bacterium]|nr:hypothetical protein [Hyphomicrobiales bacterium]
MLPLPILLPMPLSLHGRAARAQAKQRACSAAMNCAVSPCGAAQPMSRALCSTRAAKPRRQRFQFCASGGSSRSGNSG